MIDDWRDQETRNEVAFRDRNEWIRRENDRFATHGGTFAIVCECGDAACDAPISVTVAEYEAVRAYVTRFAVAPNHEDPESDVLIGEHARFTVVEKITAMARRIIRETDPRRPQGES
jgi:hypothetical protein